MRWCTMCTAVSIRRSIPARAEFKRTGALMPALSRFGVTAPSGLTRGTTAQPGARSIATTCFPHTSTRTRSLRHVLARDGATFTADDEEFLVSTSADFHPTDVLVDADGSLLVIDTGGWFRIGCPTSQIAKPEIGGAIYRIRRTDAVQARRSARAGNRLGNHVRHGDGRPVGRSAAGGGRAGDRVSGAARRCRDGRAGHGYVREHRLPQSAARHVGAGRASAAKTRGCYCGRGCRTTMCRGGWRP